MFFFFQAEDGIRDLVRSRGLGDVYKRQVGGVGNQDVLVPASTPLQAQRFNPGINKWGDYTLSLIHI